MQGWRAVLGQRGELVIGAIPLDFLVEFIAGGRSRDPQMLHLGDIGKIAQNLWVKGGAQDRVVRAARIDPRFGRCGK